MNSAAIFAIVAALPVAFAQLSSAAISIPASGTGSFSTLTTAPASISTLSHVATGTVTADPYPTECASKIGINTWSQHFSQDCANLVTACAVASEGTTYIWHKSSCVAAATCNGPSNVYKIAKCINKEIADTRAATSDFSPNIWNNIVGGGSAMTQQNYIDFYYGTLSSINSTSWPDVQTVINEQWTPVNAWTNTGANIPYKNFDDFLHYAPY